MEGAHGLLPQTRMHDLDELDPPVHHIGEAWRIGLVRPPRCLSAPGASQATFKDLRERFPR